MLDITDNLGKEQFIIIEEIKKLRNRTIFEILKRAKSFPIIICMMGIWGKNNPIHSKKTMLALNMILKQLKTLVRQ